jgi:hypothetical protein
MKFNFAAAKASARRTVHSTLAVQAFYKANSTSTPVEITARWHSGLAQHGQVNGQGAQVVEGVDQVVFNREELVLLNLALTRGGLVTFPDYQDLKLSLDTRLPYEGAIEEIWQVVRP